MNVSSNDHISIVGAAFFHGIAVLCQSLMHCAVRGAVAKHEEPIPGHDENAYCISICVLAIATIESAETRARFLEEGLEFSAHKGQFSWLCKKFPAKKTIADELAFVRGSILHNHLYKIKQVWVDDKPTITYIQKRSASGDGKFEKFVDPETYKTKTLGINVIPSQIRFIDVIHVLNAVNCLLSVLNEHSKDQLGFVNVRIEIGKKKGLKLSDLIQLLTECLAGYEAKHKTSPDTEN